MADRLARLVLAVAALAAGLGLFAVTAATVPAEGIAPLVARHIGESGVSNPVTAVLLNFRAYDTLLEVAVLVAAAVALFMLRPIEGESPAATQAITEGPAVTPLLAWFVPRLVPLAALMAGYLWWAGSSLPGGAFQAGALLGGAVILLLLARVAARPDLDDRRMRAALVAGLIGFLALALAPLAGGLAFLQYPAGWATGLILAIEAVLTLSIAACLVELAAGVPPARGRP